MRLHSIYFSGIAVLAIPFIIFAQAPSIADLEAQIAAKQQRYAKKLKEIEALEAKILLLENNERARLQTENQSKASQPKMFSIHLDCSKYTGAAREMCLKARTEPNEHERSHFINSVCRQAYAAGRKGNCIHMGWDANGNAIMTWIDEPAGTISGLIASNCTPSFFKSCHRYNTYFLQPNTPTSQKWNNISYLFDEFGAYNIGGRERLDKALNGGKADLLINIVEGPMDFVVIAASIAQYQKTTNQANFQNIQFRDFTRKQIENSMAIVRDAYEAQAAGKAFKGQSGGHTRAIYEQFLRSPQAQLLRQMYGDAWFDKTFNVVF